MEEKFSEEQSCQMKAGLTFYASACTWSGNRHRVMSSLPLQSGTGAIFSDLLLQEPFHNSSSAMANLPLFLYNFFSQVDWDVCPSDLPCCNEYGYCRSRVCRCLLALIEDLSKTWQVVDHLELESKQPLHAAWNTIYTIHYLEAWVP